MPGEADQRLVESLERAFAALAGPDARIDAAKLRSALGLRTESIARRMFELFDENGDGTISREEFLAQVRTLVAGPVRAKLAFAFRLHDEDGDGTITEAELRRMVMLGLAEDDVATAADHVEEITRIYFAHADANHDGKISFDEFEALTARYPALLAQMTRTEARWIAPNEDLLARLEPETPRPRLRVFTNRRRQLAVLAVWFAANAAMFALAFLGSSRGTALDRLGRACTSCIELDLGLVVLVVMRRLLTWVRARWLGRVLPIDDAIAFHRLVGTAVFVLAIGHGIARIATFANNAKRSFTDQLFGSTEGLTGVLVLAMLGVMWWFAREAIRRRQRFELFYFTHLLYLPVLVLAVIHAPALLAWGGVAIVGLVVEHAMRMRKRGERVLISSSTALRSGVTRLELVRPSGFTHEPGDYVFLRLPAIARHEWHPFTLSSAPEAKTLTVHARSLGNWTGALRRLVEERGGAGEPPTAFLDGPYGSPSRHIFETRFAVMIGAGIGVTPFASILESIALRDRPRGRLEKAHFFWLNRDQYSFEWFAALLAELETDKHADRLDLHIYMTGGHAGFSAAGLEVARELMHEGGRADLFTGLRAKTQIGRPEWHDVLMGIRDMHAPEPVHVFFCGPPGLAREIARITRRLDMPFREEKF